MELNNRKNEVKAETKLTNIAIEVQKTTSLSDSTSAVSNEFSPRQDLLHKATVKISDLRTEVEQGKWDNTRRGVVVIGSFVLFVIFALETAPKPPPKPKVSKPKPKPKLEGPPSPPPAHLDLRALEKSAEENGSSNGMPS